MEMKKTTRDEVVTKKVLTYEFEASFDYPMHIYKMTVKDGELVRAVYNGPRGTHREHYPYDQDYDAFRYVLKSIMFFKGFEELKNLYSVLNDGPIKNIVKSVQQEFLEKLTF